MVIEPESLIFFSVPSCAAAVPAKASAAAASRAYAVFMANPPPSGVIEKFYLVKCRRGIAQPLRRRRETCDAERRLRLHQAQEYLAVHGEQRAVGLGECIGGARRLVDEGHLAEDAARPDPLDYRAADGDGHAALHHDIHQRAGLAGDHDDLVSVIAHQGLSAQALDHASEQRLFEDA